MKHASTKHLLINQLVRQIVHSGVGKNSANLVMMIIMISTTDALRHERRTAVLVRPHVVELRTHQHFHRDDADVFRFRLREHAR